MKGVAIIGCGLIGQKRAKSLRNCKLITCVDVVEEKAKALANQFQDCLPLTDWKLAIQREDVEIVIVSTLHNSLAEIGLAAIRANKHVLLEKPGARHPDELLPLINESKNNKAFVRIGFNHRYHRAFRKARELIHAGYLGDLMFIRARYGHGGRVGYDKEWRANKELSGGGELIDQGVHLIDLARSFLGDFSEVGGFAHTYFWDMKVDDNGFLLLKTPNKKVAFLHASCTEWKNIFSFEIYGRLGKIDIQGLGGSYGTEKITFYKMLTEMGPPETTSWEYPMADDSWQVEMDEFLEDISKERQPLIGLQDAHAALKVVEEIYRESNL